MPFSELKAMVNATVVDTFKEEVYVRGQCLAGIVRNDPYDASGLEVPVEARMISVVIADADAQALVLVKDEPITVRGKDYRIRATRPNGNGLSVIEVG